MPSNKEFLDFILEQLSELDEISYRPMMGEFTIYYRDKIIGGIYDDRFLLKETKSALKMMPDVEKQLPYTGAREMLVVNNVEDRFFLKELIEAMYDELPAKKKRKL
ncbi:MAG: TfoX/Sxy family protein [Erysipelotrichaceae bacterium]|nr:TfoX/Sxy family protein [Erysipelotrichaceae bacterium]